MQSLTYDSDTVRIAESDGFEWDYLPETKQNGKMVMGVGGVRKTIGLEEHRVPSQMSATVKAVRYEVFMHLVNGNTL